MFKELVPILRDRAVLLTVTLLDEDQTRVNIVPKKLKDGDSDATQPAIAAKSAEPAKPEPPKIARLFDDPVPEPTPIALAEPKEATESFAQFAEVDDDDDESAESEELGEVA